MSVTPLFVVSLTIAVTTLGAQWIGVAMLASCGKTGPWMTLLTGAALSTVANFGVMGLSMTDPQTLPKWRTVWFDILLRMETIGTMIFFIGFALHALALVKGRARMQGITIEDHSDG